MVKAPCNTLMVALYDPCTGHIVKNSSRIDNTPDGRRFCRQVIRYFNKEFADDKDVVHNVGVFTKTHVPAVRNKKRKTR